jgi:hypothetical protein
MKGISAKNPWSSEKPLPQGGETIQVHPTFVALSLNPSPKLGRKTLNVPLPFSQTWEKGLGDEG